jgi:hypothetical protein
MPDFNFLSGLLQKIGHELRPVAINVEKCRRKDAKRHQQHDSGGSDDWAVFSAEGHTTSTIPRHRERQRAVTAGAAGRRLIWLISACEAAVLAGRRLAVDRNLR